MDPDVATLDVVRPTGVRIIRLIDGGYHTLQFTLYGLILGLWH